MTTSALGVWTPGDSDDWDLTIDLAAMANSIDTVVLNQTNTINRRNSPLVASVTERTALFPSPVQGNRVYRSDTGYEEAYFAAYSAGSNPGGATPAGWYPVSGNLPSFSVERTQAQTVTSGSQVLTTFWGTPAAYSTEYFNWTASSGTLQVLKPGLYDVTCQIQIDPTSSGYTAGTSLDTPAGYGTNTLISAQAGQGASGFNTIVSTSANHVKLIAFNTIRAFVAPQGSIGVGGGLGNKGGGYLSVAYAGPAK